MQRCLCGSRPIGSRAIGGAIAPILAGSATPVAALRADLGIRRLAGLAAQRVTLDALARIGGWVVSVESSKAFATTAPQVLAAELVAFGNTALAALSRRRYRRRGSVRERHRDGRDDDHRQADTASHRADAAPYSQNVLKPEPPKKKYSSQSSVLLPLVRS